MPRKSLFLALCVCVLCSVLAQAAPRDIIPAGTLLQCTLDEPNFSAKTAMVGDPILCHLGPLGSFGHSVFPRGALLGGHLQDAKDPGRFFGKGWIEIEFDRMILPGAEVLPLAAKVISAPHMKVDAQGDIHGKGHPKRDAVGWMIPVLWPIKLITLPMRGPTPALKGETHLALRLMEDVEVPFPVAKNSVPMPPWASPTSYRSSYDASSWDTARMQPRLASAQTPVVRSAFYTQPGSPSGNLPAQPAAQAMTVIALNDGSAFLAREYWVQDGQIYCVSSDAQQRSFPLEKIDLSQTVRVNQERNVSFVLQGRDAVPQSN
ncbi:MAG: hypothetical protein WB952_15210 [Terriglobales bacterium]